MAQTAYNVRLNGKLIDTVFYCDADAAEEVKRGLVDHDGYDPGIKVSEVKSKNKVKKKVEPIEDLGATGPVPEYKAKEWDSYMQFASFYNVD